MKAIPHPCYSGWTCSSPFDSQALFSAGFVPIPAVSSSYAGALVGAVVIEEIARFGVWQIHRCDPEQRQRLQRLHRVQQALSFCVQLAVKWMECWLGIMVAAW